MKKQHHNTKWLSLFLGFFCLVSTSQVHATTVEQLDVVSAEKSLKDACNTFCQKFNERTYEETMKQHEVLSACLGQAISEKFGNQLKRELEEAQAHSGLKEEPIVTFLENRKDKDWTAKDYLNLSQRLRDWLQFRDEVFHVKCTIGPLYQRPFANVYLEQFSNQSEVEHLDEDKIRWEIAVSIGQDQGDQERTRNRIIRQKTNRLLGISNDWMADIFFGSVYASCILYILWQIYKCPSSLLPCFSDDCATFLAHAGWQKRALFYLYLLLRIAHEVNPKI